jgi:dipeptidyl aminopeptidase/acylaminoacyl peptidase
MRIAIALALLSLPLQDAPSKPRLLDKETFFDMESVSNPAISPDGRHVVFTRSWVDKVKDEIASNLWIVDIEGRRPRELTSGSWRDSEPVWSPDGARIAFTSDRDGTSQLHLLWIDTREVAQLTRFERAPSDIAWSADGRRIAFSMFVPKKESLLDVKLPEAPKGATRAKAPVIVDRLTWARDGRGYLPPGHTHLFTIDAALGGTPRQATRGDYDHQSPAWSADGGTLYFSAIRKPDAEHLKDDSEIYAVDLDSLDVRALTERRGPDRGPVVSPDGRWIAYTGFDERSYTSHISSVYLMDSQGGQKRELAGSLASSPSNLTWARDGSGVYFGVGERGRTCLYFAPLKGSIRTVCDLPQLLSGWSLAKDGRVAAVRSTFQEPGTLVTFPVSNPRDARVLVDVNADVLDGVALSDGEELWFESKDGLKVQGWLLKPANFDAAKKYPLVLWIHGGPWSMYNVGFNWGWQNFAASEYAVLYTNPRGSTGYGQDFVNGIQYAYPGKDYDDLMAGVDAALAKGWIDEKNLFVCGGSGGGVLTAWIVGHTDRFAAACVMRPVINWHSFVGTTDGPNWYRQFRKFPWEDPMEHFERSPLSKVANVTTPTLVMTGEADLRTPIGEAEQYYRALKMLKKETLLIRVPDEYHGWRRPSHQLLQQLYLLAWFERHKR